MDDLKPKIKALQSNIRTLRTALKAAAAEASKYRGAMKDALDGFAILDRSLRITEVNPAFEAISGTRAGEVAGMRIEDFLDPDCIEFYSASRSHLSFEAVFCARDGRRIAALFNRSTLRDAAGQTTGHVVFVNDLTELKAAQDELRKAERRYHSMYRKAVQGMFQSTLAGRLIRVNPAYARILGYASPKEMLDREDSASRLYFDPAARRKMVNALRRKGFLANYEVTLRRKDGKPVWALANYHLNTDESGEPIIEGILVDHTRQKRLEKSLRRSREKFRTLSLVDSLTGLYNTRYLYQTLDRLVTESRAAGRPFSLIFMDMDNFKRVVDTHGHLNGSQALREVARTIRASIRKPCFGVAYGGDEFVVVLPGCDRKKATARAEAIRSRMKRTRYLAQAGLAVTLRASFGLAAFPEDAEDRTALLALADKALFRVKQTKKGAIGLAD
jgi:diguanylate cyclase (GGDEF)-like protein/PAS domain S-box-containing protein